MCAGEEVKDYEENNIVNIFQQTLFRCASDNLEAFANCGNVLSASLVSDIM